MVVWLPALLLAITCVFKYSNGSCELILDIYVPKAFQWYKELFNPMSFDPCNHLLKIWESIRTLILNLLVMMDSKPSQVGTHLGVWGFISSHSPTIPGAWNVILELHLWPTPLQAVALIASLRLRLRQISSMLINNKLY